MRFLRKRVTTLLSWTRERSLALFFALVGFSLGAYSSFYFEKYYLLPIFVFLILSLFFLSYKKGKKCLISFSLLFVISFSLSKIPLQNHESKSKKYQGMVIETKNNYFFFRSNFSSFYVYEKGTTREVGDFLTIYGKVKEYEETSYEGRFSFKEYLLSRGIKYSLSAYKISENFNNPLRIREKEKAFLSSLDSDSSSLIDALIFDRKDYSSSLLSKASSLDILYYFSSSGIYLSFVCKLVEKISKRFVSEKKSKVISFASLFVVSPFFFQKVGFWRVFLAKGLTFVPFKEDKLDSLGKSSLVGLILCLADYRMPLRTAFLLGEGLSLTNSLTHPTLLRFKPKERKRYEFLSLRAFLLPLHIKGAYFRPLSFVYEFIFLPLMVPLYLFGLFSFALNIPFSILNHYASFISTILNFFVSVDIIAPFGGGLGVYLTFFYYLCYMSFFYFLEIGFPKIQKSIPIIFVSFLLIRALPITNGISQEVTFINVGQGDSILIRNGNQSVLLDTGGSTKFDLGVEVDLNYLYKRKIYHLDAIIASHGDYDHIGALASLEKYILIDKLVEEKKEFPLTVAGITFRNLNTYFDDNSEENTKSLVLYAEFMNKKWLFMGDAPIEIESKIIEDNPSLTCDVIKIGHHGSKTSSSLSFLRSVSPKEAIISVGKTNSYGHPDDEVIKNLKACGITIRRTDLEGTISYTSYL